MESANPNNSNEFDFDPSAYSGSGTSFDGSEARPTAEGLYEGISFDDSTLRSPSRGAAANRPPPQPGSPLYLMEAYKDFCGNEFDEFRAILAEKQSDINWMREWIKANCKNFIDSKFCRNALLYLCQNYASKEQQEVLQQHKWHLGFMLAVVESLLLDCQRKLSKSERGVRRRALYDKIRSDRLNEARFIDDNHSSSDGTNNESQVSAQGRSPYDPSAQNEACILEDMQSSPNRRNVEYEQDVRGRSLYDPSIHNEAGILDDTQFSPDRRNVGYERDVRGRSLYDPSTHKEACILDDRQFTPDGRNVEYEQGVQGRSLYDPSTHNEAFILDDVRDARINEREMLRISPSQQEYSEQRLDDSLLIDETPPRHHSRSSSPPDIRITPPSPTDFRTRISQPSTPTDFTTPPRTPYISKSRFGFTDPSVPPEELNIPPGPFEIPTPFRKTIALSSPKRVEPLLVNIGVDPKPLIDTERGERFVCDISIDVQPGGSGLRAKLPDVRGRSPTYQLGTSVDTGRERAIEMSASPVIKRGRIGQYSAYPEVTPTGTGLFTPRVYRRPRRRRILGSDPIPELPWSPTYLPEDTKSKVTSLTSSPYWSDRSMSWGKNAENYYGSSPKTSSAAKPYGYRSPDFWDSVSPVIKGPTYRYRSMSPSPSPVIKGPTYRYRSISRSPSPVIKRPPYGYRSPDFWSRPIYEHRSPYSDRSSQSPIPNFSLYGPEVSGRYFSSDRTNMKSQTSARERSLYDPSTYNEACILDDRQFSHDGRNVEYERDVQGRSLYDPSTHNEAGILDDRQFSPDGRNVGYERGVQGRSLYDPSTLNEACFLDDRQFSPDRRNVGYVRDVLGRSLYDPSTHNEAGILDDIQSSPDRRNAGYERGVQGRSLYDPSTANEACFLDDSRSSSVSPNIESEEGYLEGSLYDSSKVNEARFLD